MLAAWQIYSETMHDKLSKNWPTETFAQNKFARLGLGATSIRGCITIMLANHMLSDSIC